MVAPASRSSPSPSPRPPWRDWQLSSAPAIRRRPGRPTRRSATRTGSRACESATGRDLDLMLRIDQASVILALDADPLLTDPEMIRHARGFAAGRRAGASGGAMNRLYAVEGVFSLTGAMADHRLRLESRQIAPFLAALAARLALRPEPRARRSRRPGCRPALDRRPCQGPSGEPRQGIDRGWGSPARGRPRRRLRPERRLSATPARRSATSRRRTRRFRA